MDQHVTNELPKENWRMALAAKNCRIILRTVRHGTERILEGRMYLDGWKSQMFPVPVQKEGPYTYALLDDENAIIIDCESKEEHVIFPAKIAGRRVLAVSGLNCNEYVKCVTIEKGIFQFCCDFMRYCGNLERIEIPSSLVRIAEGFCQGCFALQAFQVAENRLGFAAKDGVLFDQSGKYLLRYPPAREGDVYTIPSNVDKIWSDAFGGSVNLKKIIVPDGFEQIDEGAFRSSGIKTIELPATLKRIGKNAFEMSGLESVDIPDCVEQIGDSAFAYCTRLTEVKLPAALKTLGDFAFRDCRALFSLQLPEGLETLEGTFYECWDLEHVYIPASVTAIGKFAFAQENKEAVGPGMEPLTIHGEAGSFAEKFARDRGLPFENGLWKETIQSHWVLEETAWEALAAAKEGDLITFGHYNQQVHRKQKDPVGWRVLKREQNHLLLLSEYCMEYGPFDSKQQNPLWENCELRNWLNGEFLKECFTETEKNAILVTTVRNMEPKDEAGIFCLSVEEVEEFLKEQETRLVPLIPSARIWCGREGGMRWWLRTEGTENAAATIWYKGLIDTQGEPPAKNLGIRPALWLDLEKIAVR